MPLRDPLTRLPTEALFRDRLRQALVLARRKRARIAVVQLIVTDAGELDSQPELVAALARRLEQQLRASDTVSRIDGRGFTILLNDVDSRSAARAVAEELVLALAKPLAAGGRQFQLGACYGLALFPDDGDAEAALLRAADDAVEDAQLG